MSCGARPFENTEKEILLAGLTGRYQWRDRAMVQLGTYSGLRLGSVLTLVVGDVFDGKRFRARLRIARRNLKNRREGQDLPFHPVAKFAVGRWLVTLRRRGVALHPEMPIFLSREGSAKAVSRRRVQEIVQDAAWRVGLPAGISTHSWRKTFAGKIYERSGHNILLVSKALNHRQLSTSIHYLSWKLNERADAAILSL
jgi:site-specific recombinase XerC